MHTQCLLLFTSLCLAFVSPDLANAATVFRAGAAKLEEREGEPYFEYSAFLTRRIADGVLRAHNQLEPARIAWGVVEEPTQVFNRRWFVKPERGPIYGAHDNIEQVKMNPGYTGLLRPAGPVDPQITFVSVKSTSGKPISLLASYGLHYVGGVPANTISADYFAIFADRVGELLGADRHHGQRRPRLPADARTAQARRLRNVDRCQQGAARRLGEDGGRLGRNARRAHCEEAVSRSPKPIPL
ncbi:MAG: hypothetical protein FJ395_13785 [Verrucomicrobia bacterium]|nr:hypothetical protein [Verrucomicrobiota bacterium]